MDNLICIRFLWNPLLWVSHRIICDWNITFECDFKNGIFEKGELARIWGHVVIISGNAIRIGWVTTSTLLYSSLARTDLLISFNHKGARKYNSPLCPESMWLEILVNSIMTVTQTSPKAVCWSVVTLEFKFNSISLACVRVKLLWTIVPYMGDDPEMCSSHSSQGRLMLLI